MSTLPPALWTSSPPAPFRYRCDWFHHLFPTEYITGGAGARVVGVCNSSRSWGALMAFSVRLRTCSRCRRLLQELITVTQSVAQRGRQPVTNSLHREITMNGLMAFCDLHSGAWHSISKATIISLWVKLLVSHRFLTYTYSIRILRYAKNLGEIRSFWPFIFYNRK